MSMRVLVSIVLLIALIAIFVALIIAGRKRDRGLTPLHTAVSKRVAIEPSVACVDSSVG